jgi:hypothetical protein
MKTIIEKKKGIMLNEAFPAVLALVLIAMLVIVGLVLFGVLGGTSLSNISQTENADSITMAGPTETAFPNATVCGFTKPSVINVTDDSYVLIAAGNYTLSATGITNTTSDIADGTWLISYTYYFGDKACTAATTTVTQFAAYPALIGLVGIVIFLGLVIGVLIGSFVFGGKKGV